MNRRTQLTLFVPDPIRIRIEAVRQVLDPEQHRLIPAHVTLCRDDELAALPADLIRLQFAVGDTAPITLRFAGPQVFDGHGILLPCNSGSDAFHALRAQILGAGGLRRAEPHITLAHPRNPKAPGNSIANAAAVASGMMIRFRTASLIEQVDGEPWKVVEEFGL